MMAQPLRLILSLLLLQSASVFSAPLDDLTAVQKLPAPVGCKKLPIDADWPSPDVVKEELPGAEEPMPDGVKKHPNYIYEVRTVASVQRAVRFVAKHNVRLSIINSGHDFLGR
jgi:hypothetical protein